MRTQFQRIVFNQVPLYINPQKPDWFIPTKQADFILQDILKGLSIEESVDHHLAKLNYSREQAIGKTLQLIKRCNNEQEKFEPHTGRHHFKKLEQLKECWFHLTNQCNMRCNHCLFCSGPEEKASIPYDQLLENINEALSLGCKIFYFTGGEPFIYKGFTDICDHLLNHPDTHVVVLTNLKNIRHFQSWLEKLPDGRFHIQASIEGLQANHDHVRGEGAFTLLMKNLAFLRELKLPASLAMTVTKNNYKEMPSLVDIAREQGVPHIHFLWLFIKGHAKDPLFAEPSSIFNYLKKTEEKANAQGIMIDNLEILKSQLYSLPGTRYDLNNSGWESITVGPDGHIYPSAALVGEEAARAGNAKDGLENVWRKSELLNSLRKETLKETHSPLHLLLGGGDTDHSFIRGGHFTGHDPYLELYEKSALHLLTNHNTDELFNTNNQIGLIKKMGEKLYECNEDQAAVGFTHSNCVLSLPGKDGYSSVNSFYSSAATEVNEDIVNPVQYDQEQLNHIPDEARVRSYGCGSPVLDGNIKSGENVVDLGSGTGTECFLAAKEVGKTGHVSGIDMSEAMLKVAKQSAQKVAKNLGYENVHFYKGYLESLPLQDQETDIVISNCVINLSPDKRETFKEINRVLKPGGRLVISDIICNDPVPLEMKYNEKLRGECLGGAMREVELFGMLEDLGFEQMYVIKRFLYREVKGYQFYSVTYKAYKPQPEKTEKEIIYRGPHEYTMFMDGTLLFRGIPTKVLIPENYDPGEDFFLLDEKGQVTNIEQEITCSCFSAPEDTPAEKTTAPHKSDCMVCGAPLDYKEQYQPMDCYYCGKEVNTNTVCTENHFVCDNCHSLEARDYVNAIAKEARHSDMVSLMKEIRKHPSMQIHGPEHHFMVPSIILSVYKNQGGKVSDADFDAAIERGSTIAGGSCAFMGVCGAASGTGIGFSILLKSNPYLGEPRKQVQSIASDVLSEIARYKAARCCQRDCWLALRKASELSTRYLDISLPAEDKLVCEQHSDNKECMGKECPIFE